MRRAFRRLFERDTLGQAIFPLAVLTLLYFFDEFDTAAMGVLAPDIKKSFGLSDSDFVGLVAVNGVLVAVLTVPLGYYADRIRRTRIVVASGIVADPVGSSKTLMSMGSESFSTSLSAQSASLMSSSGSAFRSTS